MIDLLRTLIRLSFGQTDSTFVAEARYVLQESGPARWNALLKTLELHRTVSLVAYAIDTHNLTDSVPQPARSELQNAYRETTLTNMVLMRALVRVIDALRQRGVEPVIWKGVLLADSFYPDPGTRWMGDIDLVIEADERDETIDAFASVDFQPFDSSPDCIHFNNRIGILFDVHNRVRLFEGKQSMKLTTDVSPQHIELPTIHVLEPTAMIVLLVHHLNGHRPGEGYPLRWLIDIAFVMRRWGDSIDLQRLDDLLPSRRHWVLLLRTVRFLESEFHATFPSVFAELAANVEPLTLAEVLRQRRLSQWNLRTLRGWLRLGACRVGAWPLKGRVLPHLSDLLIWPRDVVCERRALREPLPLPAAPNAAGDEKPGRRILP